MIAATSESGARLRLPAFGRKILALRSQGLAPNMAVLVVDGWAPVENLDEYTPWVVVVPDGSPADDLDFRCIAGLFVLIMAATVGRVDALALQVLRFGPRAVFGWLESWAQLVFYVKGRR